MRAQRIVVIAIDRLGAGWLGPYGNTWLETPHFNRLASSSLLCETAIADAPDLGAVYRGYWSGRHILEPVVDASLPLLAAAAGLKPVLVTDDERLSADPRAAGFAELRRVAVPPNSVAAGSMEQTGLFHLTTAAIEALAEKDAGLIWIHSRGMDGPWDAPLELRNQFADLDDPQPPALVEPPAIMLPENFDPDELLGLTQAYAGQVTLADDCLGMLLAALDEHPLLGETLLIVTSPRGYPLGEHRRVGAGDDSLYAELLQVPLLVRFPGDAAALVRTQSIVQPASVFATIAEAIGGAALPQELRGISLARLLDGESLHRSDAAVSIGPNQRSIRTSAWFLREVLGDSPQRELFAKPDDRWEFNEVASRCGDVAELLAARLDEFAAAAGAGRLAELPPLAELLADVWR
jgi:arylsulfatase A-like enzyme